jgi:acylphosphatase
LSKKRVRLLVTGKVQGVAFRAHTREIARSLGLTGWVRNLPDGRVEALAEGDEKSLESFIAWCHKGPRSARVAGVALEWSDPTGEHASFDIT